jgi:hypothetical protein
MQQKHKTPLLEGLETGDLKNCIAEMFTIDRYSSKMGEDKDIVVLGFTVREKNPAIDLMEFIEKGYDFILDADMSTGEEHDGKYQVFAEIQRSPSIAENISMLLNGIGQLCDCNEWRFRYQKDSSSVEFSPASILEHVPTTPEEYESRITEYKQTDLTDFFDQGSVSVMLENDNTLTFKKPYAEPIKVKFIAIGDYEAVKKHIPGKLSLDESSQGQCFFLNKYLGTYDIDKIGNRFLIGKGDQAVVIEKERW